MAEAAVAAETIEVVNEGPPAGPPGVLRDRFLIRSNVPLPDLSTPNAEAYATEDRRDTKRSLYALICRPELPPRVNVMRALRGVSSLGLQQLVEWGPMTWPPLGRQCMTVVYERPVGKRVMPSMRSEIRRIDEYDITRKVIEPLVNAVKELRSRGITHRAVRPTNLYYMDEAGERLAIGDCATAPPAFDQPIVFETIESGMCNPIARGSGTYSDDLYALGVTLVFLLMGRNPVAHLDDDALLRAKIQSGQLQRPGGRGAAAAGDDRGAARPAVRRRPAALGHRSPSICGSRAAACRRSSRASRSGRPAAFPSRGATSSIAGNWRWRWPATGTSPSLRCWRASWNCGCVAPSRTRNVPPPSRMWCAWRSTPPRTSAAPAI